MLCAVSGKYFSELYTGTIILILIPGIFLSPIVYNPKICEFSFASKMARKI